MSTVSSVSRGHLGVKSSDARRCHRLGILRVPRRIPCRALSVGAFVKDAVMTNLISTNVNNNDHDGDDTTNNAIASANAKDNIS